MRSASYLWIYLLLLIAANVGIILSSKHVRTVRRGPGSDPQCMSSLIKSREEFPDSAFSASSTLEDRVEFQPYQARLTEVYGSKEHTSGHAWCPSTPIGESLREWIQAEFTDLVLIGAIFTAGRGDGNVKEFMPSFVLKYQREDDGPWFEHVKRDGTRVLKANSDPRNLARATLDSMVIAKRIRIYPYSREGKQQVCLRFALYGCKFPDGVVSYSMSQGGDRSPGLSYSSSSAASSNPIGSASANFRDLSYDGQMIGTHDHLTDGMGQLMDNVAYLGNVTNPLALHPSQPGFHFVGWYQHGQTDVPIVFKFDTIRTFTWVRLFTFDSIPLRARLFSRVVVAFSLDGQTYNNSVEVFTGRAQLFDPRTAAFSRTRRAGDESVYGGVDRFGKRSHATSATAQQGDPLIYVDQDWDGALVLETDLGGRKGRYVRVSLTATDGWILLSEVQFNSTIAKTNAKTIAPASNTGVVTGAELRGPIDAGNGGLASPGANWSHNQGTSENGFKPSTAIGKSSADMSDKNSADGDASQSPNGMTDEAAGSLQVSARDSFANPLPFIIAIAILLFLLSTVVLIWLCTRRHQKRSQLRLHRKGLIGSDSGKTGFHPSTPGGIHHVPGSTDLPGIHNTHEATKLLSPPYPGLTSNLRIDGLPNGIHPPSGPLNRLNESSAPHMGTGATMNGPAALGLVYPVRPGPGVILPCSPSSSCSSHASADPMSAAGCSVTVVSTMASPVQAPTTTDMPHIYAGTDLGCMSPEYASASLFGFTPPPSDVPCSSAPPTCTETMPATNYRPSIPNYTISFTNPGQGLVSGSANVYTGPASMPANTTTLRLSSQHATPNMTQRFQANQAAGVLFLPHSSAMGTSQRMDDPTAIYQTRVSGFPNGIGGGASYNIYQTQSSVMGPTQELIQHRADGQRTLYNAPQETWMLSSHPGELHATTRLADGRVVSGNGVCGGLTEPSLLNAGPVQLLTANGLMDLSQQYSPNVSPQHYYPTQLIFPPVPPPSNRPAMDSSIRAAHMDQQTFNRANPVGANASSVGASGVSPSGNNGGYVIGATEPCARDGASSGRLSIYSVCI